MRRLFLILIILFVSSGFAQAQDANLDYTRLKTSVEQDKIVLSEMKTGNRWNVSTGQLRETIIGYSDLVHAVTFSPDGKTLASSGFQEILLWDASTGEHLKSFTGHKGTVESIAFSPDGKMLAGGSYQEIVLWDVHEAKRSKTLTGPYKNETGVYSIVYLPDGKKLVSLSGKKSSNHRQVVLWDIKKGKHQLIPIPPKNH